MGTNPKPRDTQGNRSAEVASRVARNITMVRRVQGLTMRDLAARVNASTDATGVRLDQSQLSRIETRRRGLLVEELVAIAEALDTEPALLLAPVLALRAAGEGEKP